MLYLFIFCTNNFFLHIFSFRMFWSRWAATHNNKVMTNVKDQFKNDKNVQESLNITATNHHGFQVKCLSGNDDDLTFDSVMI